jgi:hypothetical protein
MFDANMRHLPKGKKFFAEMCGVRENHPIKQFNLTSRLILCEMLSDCNDNPTVRFFHGGKFMDMTDDEDGRGSWFVYSGNIDGTGFICDDMKREAMSLLT